MVCDWGRGGYVRDVYLSVVSSVLVNTSKADHQRRDEDREFNFGKMLLIKRKLASSVSIR